MGELGDWANFVFLGKFLKKFGRFIFHIIFYISGQKNRKFIISGHNVTNATKCQHWFFKSVHLVIKILYLMLESF